MDPSLSNAVMKGHEVELDRLIQRPDIQHQLTQNNSTVLHVAAQFGRLTCVRRILDPGGSSFLLNRKNIKGNTALHVAARQRHTDIVDELVRFANHVGIGTAMAMLREPNEDGDMALHLAVKNGELEMVESLTTADPQFQHPPNKANKTPLYLACERGYDDIVSRITSPTYSVADGGRNALHAAVVSKCTVETMEDLLGKQPHLIEGIDEYGWTPLHWAVRINNVDKVAKLLKKDQSSVAYTSANDDDDKIALHIAAAHGYVEVMEMLLSHSPDSWEIVDGKGQNILHIAVEAEQVAVIYKAEKYLWFEHLKNQKDNVGNTPLDLASSRRWLAWLDRRLRGNDMNLTVAPINWDQISRDKHYIITQKQELKEQRSRSIGYQEQVKKQMKESRELLSKISESYLIVATVIATIAFTLGFTIPSIVSSSNSGEPIVLLKDEAFKAFLVTNSIAAICSIVSVVFLIIVSSDNTDPDPFKHNYMADFYLVVYFVVRVSIIAILVAFVTGTYMVLITRGLVITICVIAFPPFLLTLPYSELKKICKTIFERIKKIIKFVKDKS